MTISDLSLYITSVGAGTDVIPFVLYGHDHVLAHPLLISWAPAVTDRDQPLVALDALGDPVLERIWSPDHDALFLLEGLTEASSSGVEVGDDYYVFLYRGIDRYGPEPWTIGAYVNTGTSDVGEWLAQVVRSALSGSFEDTGTVEGNEFELVVATVLAGVAVFVLSVAVAAWLGARASRPIRALATAARSIEARGLDGIAPLPPSRVTELDDANRSFNRMVAGLRESELVRQTLGRFVPTDVARTLLTEGGELAPEQAQATVLFCDLEGFTALTETLGPAGIVELLNEYFEVMVEILERHRGVVTQFQGDAILATFNVPVPDPAHAANALQAAIEMQDATRRREFAGQRIGSRIGINTGRLVAGAVGAKGRLSYTVHGDAVNLAARLEALNKELGTRVLVSGATAGQVEGFDLRPMGEVGVRGQTGQGRGLCARRLIGSRIPPPGGRDQVLARGQRAARLVEAPVPVDEPLDVDVVAELERVDAAAAHERELIRRDVSGNPQLAAIAQVFAQPRGDAEEAAVRRARDRYRDEIEALDVAREAHRIAVDRETHPQPPSGAFHVREEIAAPLQPAGEAHREITVGRRFAGAGQVRPGVGALPPVDHEPGHDPAPP